MDTNARAQRPSSLKRRAALSLAFALAGACVFASAPKKPDSTEQKIRLMAEVLQAQDAGDYDRAEEKLGALLQISPNDPQLRRMLQSVREKRELKARTPVVPPPAPEPVAVPAPEAPVAPTEGPASFEQRPRPVPEQVPAPAPAAMSPRSSAPSDPDALLAWELTRQQELLAQAKAKLAHGLSLAKEERFKEALDDFREAELLLPRNTLTQALRAQLEASRNDVEHRQRVAGFTLGATSYRLSTTRLPLDPSQSGSPSGTPRTLDIQVLELPPDVFADLLVAWAEICREERERSWNSGVLIDHRGRVMFHRKNEPLSTIRQMELFWALQDAALKPASQIQSRSPEGLVGVSGRFDSEHIVRALLSLDGCRLLGAPRVELDEAGMTVLTLSEETAAPVSSLQRDALGAAPQTGVELRLRSLKPTSGGGASFWISPAVVQYEGRVISGEASPVYSRHETGTTLSLNQGGTAILGGLEREEGRAIAGRETVAQRLPFVGEIIKDRSAAERQREIVIFATLR